MEGRSLDIAEWVRQVSNDGWIWYLKYLSGNDTLLNNSHQAGPYIPKHLLLGLFPSLRLARSDNPRAQFQVAVDSHAQSATPTAIWYNNRIRGGTRDECRITNWGGRQSALLDPESTGSLCAFAFAPAPGRDVGLCRVWLCRDPSEEDFLVEIAGAVDPGSGRVFVPVGALDAELVPSVPQDECWLNPGAIPAEWLSRFPSASEIRDLTISRRPETGSSPDKRLLRRRDCEFELFRSVEEAVVLPRVREGFPTVEAFIEFANSVTNRRKSRSGASLELHMCRIFDEEHLAYSYNEVSEEQKRPDFLFPSAAAYHDDSFPSGRLQMLAVKTTCKDRWRQVLNEADRISEKPLLTLQQGISLTQFAEMHAAGVRLVVPAELRNSYHISLRAELITVQSFIAETRIRCM